MSGGAVQPAVDMMVDGNGYERCICVRIRCVLTVLMLVE